MDDCDCSKRGLCENQSPPRLFKREVAVNHNRNHPEGAFSWHVSRVHFGLALLSIAILGSGCTALNSNRSINMAEVDENTPTYKVILANNLGGKPQIFTGRVSDSTTVQDALVASGAVEKYRGMTIDLARRVPEKDQVLKLPVIYDGDARHVIDAQNYAIHEGDELLVRKNNPGAFEAMFKSLGTGPSAMY